MKKLLPFLLLTSLQVNSQSLILTQAFNQPMIGDTSRQYVLDTAYYVGGLNHALTGANTVWTYSNLVTTTVVTTFAIINPSTVPTNTDYPGAGYVEKAGTLNTFYKTVSSPSTQTEFMGITSTSLNMNLTNTAVNMRYPLAFGNVITDSFSGNFTFSLSGTASGNATVTADGTGTLVLPGGVTFTNVLRVKSYQNTDFNAIIITGNMKQTSYTWYAASQKYPILTINYQTFSIAGSPTISAQVLGNKNNFTIGMKENSFDNSLVKFYPNPISDELTVSALEPFLKQEVRIYNVTGQELKHGTAGKINCSDLSSGIYIAELSTEKGIIRKKIIKE